MNKPLGFLLFFLLTVTIQAQNLVPNSSFELCNSQCTLNENNNVFDGQNWKRSNANTSDIYSTLLPVSCQMRMPAIAPLNIGYLGEQLPRTGNVLGGFINEGRLWTPRDTLYGYPHPYREYFSTALSSPLEIGKTYCASMYVSLPGNNDHCSNNIGMYFSDTVVATSNYKAIYANPQLIEKKVIKDTVNWVLISGCFVADKAFDYLTIGNFLPMNSTLFQNRSGMYTSMNYFISYYYLEDISVEEFTPHALVTMKDTAICAGGSIRLVASGPDHIWWSTVNEPNDTLAEGNELTVSPDVSTTYIVHGFDCKCSVESKTIQVDIYPLSNFSLGADTAVCEHAYADLYLPSGFTNPIWSDGTTRNNLPVFETGIYWLKANDVYGCEYSDTLVITNIIPLPKVDLGPDFVFCEPVLLRADAKYKKYIWQNQTTASSIYTVNNAGEYTLAITNECGYASDTLSVYAPQNIFIPNLITPNEDGMNDYFQIQGLPINQYGLLKVYNNWGQLVYENNNYNNSWNASELSSGVYYYFYSFDCFESKSWVQVVK